MVVFHVSTFILLVHSTGGSDYTKRIRHIRQYENELLNLKNQGLTHNEIADKVGLT